MKRRHDRPGHTGSVDGLARPRAIGVTKGSVIRHLVVAAQRDGIGSNHERTYMRRLASRVAGAAAPRAGEDREECHSVSCRPGPFVDTQYHVFGPTPGSSGRAAARCDVLALGGDNAPRQLANTGVGNVGTHAREDGDRVMGNHGSHVGGVVHGRLAAGEQ